MISTDPRIKHLRWSLGEDDSQCHPRTATNDSLFLSIKATVRNVASDPWGHRTPWHQAQYHVMVSLSRALINTRKRDHGQSCAHYHSSLRGLVCLFTDVGKRMQAGQIRGKKKKIKGKLINGIVDECSVCSTTDVWQKCPQNIEAQRQHQGQM